jgi:hypothetical protein
MHRDVSRTGITTFRRVSHGGSPTIDFRRLGAFFSRLRKDNTMPKSENQHQPEGVTAKPSLDA